MEKLNFISREIPHPSVNGKGVNPPSNPSPFPVVGELVTLDVTEEVNMEVKVTSIQDLHFAGVVTAISGDIDGEYEAHEGSEVNFFYAEIQTIDRNS